jgi:uncharacterized protein (DUF1778 family)
VIGKAFVRELTQWCRPGLACPGQQILVRTSSGRYDEFQSPEEFIMAATTSPVTPPSKSERIDVRASLPVKQLLQEAARASHKNVSEFLLEAGISAANQALADRNRFKLNEEQWAEFQRALDAPVQTKPRLKQLLSEPGVLD